MRRTRLLLPSLLISIPLTLVGAGCGDSGGAAPPEASDAAVDDADARADAGGSGGAVGDASEPETNSDAGQDGAPDGDLEDASEPQEAGEQDGSPDSGPDAEDASQPDGAQDAEPDVALPFQLRIVAANLTSGNKQSYDEGAGIRILQGIHPDVVLIQEFKYGDNSDTSIRSFVDTAFSPTFAYYRESALLPNGVVSRYPILEAGRWADPEVVDRGFAWARIDLPGPRDLWAVSVHLLNTGTVTERNNEVKAILGNLSAQVPSLDALVVIGGDMNTPTRTEACYKTLAGRFVTAGPWPVDQSNNSNTNAKRQLPYDWVIASNSLDPLEIPVAIGANTFPSGLVVDTRVYDPISDLSPALQTDSAALYMQHMAVVRDFLIP